MWSSCWHPRQCAREVSIRTSGLAGRCAARIALLVAISSAALHSEERWNIQYFYDENKSSLTITDLKFPSERRGIASGYIKEKEDKIRPMVLITSDGGAHWTLNPVKEPGISLFFLDDSTGWMVTSKGLWKTEESGRNWHKLKSPKDILRVWFLDRQKGWAIGLHKSVFETADGGATWKPVEAAAKPAANPQYTTYGAVAFANSKAGVIAGWNTPPRHDRDASLFPDWMDPEKARHRKQWPSLLIFLQTQDGGKSWTPSTASIFGRLTRMSFLPTGFGLGLIEFMDDFEYPSEVYKISPGLNNNTRVFREKNRWITDVLMTPHGSYAAGLEPVGTVRRSPIPGKLKILTSENGDRWREMSVDYRADAHRAYLAGAGNSVWVATDTGMILKLQGS